jgi:heat shock protein HslJ
MKPTTLIVKFSIALFVTLPIAACAALTPRNVNPLDGTSWRLLAYGGKESIPGTEANITFSDGWARGSTGCNTFQGEYQAQGDHIAFKDLAITEMACLEPEGIMEQEQTIMNYLWDAQRYVRQSDQLRILRSDTSSLHFILSE